MKRFNFSLNFLPLLIIVAYQLLTIMIFFQGPINWGISDSTLLIIFLTTVLLSITLGYCLNNSITGELKSETWSKSIFLVGCFGALALFYPTVKVYTGSEPWDFYKLLGHQGRSYSHMLSILAEESIERKIVSVCRTFIAPFSIAVIPLGILCWSKCKYWHKSMLLLYILSQLIFSVMRGTDKEVVDLLIISFGTSLVLLGRHYLAGRLPNFRKMILCFSIAAVFLGLAFSLFSARKLDRLGNNAAFCFSPSHFCVSYDGPILSRLSAQNKFGLAMLSVYLSHGYYGLYLALDQPFEPMYGLGHSFFLTSWYVKLTNDMQFYERSYLSKIKNNGWDDKGVWSSIFPWIANDLSFFGVPFFLIIVAYYFAKCWYAAIYRSDNMAAILFSMLFLVFIYLPANNQITQTIDLYYAFWFWTVVWIIREGSIGHFIPLTAKPLF